MTLAEITRLDVAEKERKILELQREIHELKHQIKQANYGGEQSLVCICSYCKSIRNKQDEWESIEKFFSDHFSSNSSHGVCGDCKTELIRELESDSVAQRQVS